MATQLVDTKTMATLLGVARSTLYEQVQTGRITIGVYKVGDKAIRFDPDAVLTALRIAQPA